MFAILEGVRLLFLESTPLDWVTTHVPLIGWGTVMFGIYKGTRFLTKLEERVLQKEQQFNEAHKVITNDLVHSMDKLVELAQKQDRRWETFMTNKAFARSGGHITMEEFHAHDVCAEAADSDTSTEL